jgi:hypothetical protein
MARDRGTGVTFQILRDGAWVDAPWVEPPPTPPARRPAEREEPYGDRVARRRAALLSHLGAVVWWIDYMADIPRNSPGGPSVQKAAT